MKPAVIKRLEALEQAMPADPLDFVVRGIRHLAVSKGFRTLTREEVDAFQQELALHENEANELGMIELPPKLVESAQAHSDDLAMELTGHPYDELGTLPRWLLRRACHILRNKYSYKGDIPTNRS